MTKLALRQQFMAQRRALSAEEVARRSLAIAVCFWSEDVLGEKLTLPTQGIVHTFLPIVRQNEVGTWPIVHRIWQDFPDIQVAVSVSDTTTNRLAHYTLTPETPLIENRWGIPEPIHTGQSAIDSQQIDVVLVPLLAFDAQGHRVGYGKGYYDRFLAECRPNCLKIGLSLFEPVERIGDVESTDIRLHSCVTPNKVWSFDEEF